MNMYLVWDADETAEYADLIYAPDDEEAAVCWAEVRDQISGDFEIARSNMVVVNVQHKENGSVVKFELFGSFNPTYTAYRKRDEQ